MVVPGTVGSHYRDWQDWLTKNEEGIRELVETEVPTMEPGKKLDVETSWMPAAGLTNKPFVNKRSDRFGGQPVELKRRRGS